MKNDEKYPFGYIYITTNLINNKKYIGMHRSENFDPSYKGSGKILTQAFKKYGKKNFSTEVIEWCYNENELQEKEKYWIEYYKAVENDNWYNLIPGGGGVQLFGDDNPFYGRHHTQETKDKISENLKGRFVGENNPMYGVHLIVSDEVRKKMSESHKGLLVGDKNPMYGKPAHNRGKPMSDETKKKLSKSLTGKHPNIPLETQEKLRKLRSERMAGEKNPQFGKKGKLSPKYGTHPSEETLKKISESRKGKQRGFENPACKPIYDINSNMVFSCTREVAEYFTLTYGQARNRIEKEIPIAFNKHIYILTRDKQKIRR